jgi:hypothetical protein
MELIPSLDNYVVTGSLTSLKTGANGDTLDRLSYPEGSPLQYLMLKLISGFLPRGQIPVRLMKW